MKACCCRRTCPPDFSHSTRWPYYRYIHTYIQMYIASLFLLVGQLFCSRRHDSVSLLSFSLSRFFIDVCLLEYSYAFNFDSTSCTVKPASPLPLYLIEPMSSPRRERLSGETIKLNQEIIHSLESLVTCTREQSRRHTSHWISFDPTKLYYELTLSLSLEKNTCKIRKRTKRDRTCYRTHIYVYIFI